MHRKPIAQINKQYNDRQRELIGKAFNEKQAAAARKSRLKRQQNETEAEKRERQDKRNERDRQRHREKWKRIFPYEDCFQKKTKEMNLNTNLDHNNNPYYSKTKYGTPKEYIFHRLGFNKLPYPFICKEGIKIHNIVDHYNNGSGQLTPTFQILAKLGPPQVAS